MTNTPLVSIIIPTYNRAHLIGETLNSILAQTYTHWECIVVDDGSTDNTVEVLSRYLEQDVRFQYHHRPKDRPKGANACRNFGFDQSKGDYINWFDSDDLMAFNKLEVQLNAMKQNPDSPYCICQTEWIDKNSNTSLGLRAKAISSNNRFEDYILHKIFWSILAPLWRREFIVSNQLCFDEVLYQSQEYDFHIKALAVDSKYIVLNDVLAFMYKHDDNLSNNIFSSDLKIESNVSVKLYVLKTYSTKLSTHAKFKVFEGLTLIYKEALLLKKFKLAKKILKCQIEGLFYLRIANIKKIIFCFKLYAAYLSYRIFGKGYGLVAPIKQTSSYK